MPSLADIPAIAPHVLGQVARYGCCRHCTTFGCDRPDNHESTCPGGCDVCEVPSVAPCVAEQRSNDTDVSSEPAKPADRRTATQGTTACTTREDER